jgi:hypothetical protein
VKNGFTPLQLPLCPQVDRPIAGHPDIQLCVIEHYIIYQPEIDSSFLHTLTQALSHTRYTLVKGQSLLQHNYPYDCAYNVAYTGKIAFHNTKVTDNSITQILAQLHKGSDPIIHVNQGYTKCSTCIVDSNAIITSDRSIHNAACNHSIDSLLISPGYVQLPGYTYGFIGGASGLCSDRIYFTGHLKEHPDYTRIEHFIAAHNKTIVFLSDLPAIDIGSIFFIDITS